MVLFLGIGVVAFGLAALGYAGALIARDAGLSYAERVTLDIHELQEVSA